jgi:hypothetical protein
MVTMRVTFKRLDSGTSQIPTANFGSFHCEFFFVGVVAVVAAAVLVAVIVFSSSSSSSSSSSMETLSLAVASVAVERQDQRRRYWHN